MKVYVACNVMATTTFLCITRDRIDVHTLALNESADLDRDKDVGILSHCVLSIYCNSTKGNANSHIFSLIKPSSNKH